MLGSPGFLGSKITKALFRKKIEVVGVSRNREGKQEFRYEQIFADKKELSREAPGMVDAVIDVCSYTSSDLALQIAENCTYVLVSSTSVYEKTHTVYTKSNIKLDYDSKEPYIRGKIETELYLQKYQEQNLILRPCMIIGPGENTGRTKELKELSTEGRELKTSREPSNLIQLIDVRDCKSNS